MSVFGAFPGIPMLVGNEVLERVPKAVHLRTAGFDVIEATDWEEARRALDSVPVNVVLADLAMPDQTNGLAFLRWLRTLRQARPGRQPLRARPTLTCRSPIFASSSAMMTSHRSAMLAPRPTAGPLTIAITGLGKVSMALKSERATITSRCISAVRPANTRRSPQSGHRA